MGVMDDMIINRNGKRLVTICEDSEQGHHRSIGCLWDVTSGRQVVQWSPLSEQIVGFSPNDQTLIAAKDGKPAALRDAATGKMIHAYNNDSKRN